MPKEYDLMRKFQVNKALLWVALILSISFSAPAQTTTTIPLKPAKATQQIQKKKAKLKKPTDEKLPAVGSSPKIVSVPPPSRAQEIEKTIDKVEAKSEEKAESKSEEKADGWEQAFVKSNMAVADWFDGVAEGLDLFLVGKKVTNDINETNATISNVTYYNEREEPVNTTSFNLNVRLPNVEKYWQLKFTDENEERGVREKTVLRQAPRQKKYGATVGLFQKLGNVRAAFQPRIGLQDPLDVSHSLAFESVADLEKYKVNPKFEFFATPEKGAGLFQALNFNFLLTKVYSLTFINEGEYEEKRHLYTVNNGFSLGQSTTRRSSMSYSIFFTSVNQPNYQLAGYSLSVSWSELVYRKILDYSITPYLNFGREKNFAGVPGIAFNFNLNF